MTPTATQRQRRLRLLLTVLATLVLLALVVPYVFIHFIEGPAPARLSLPSGSGSNSTSATALAGTWNVGPGSTTGYRVEETLLGQTATAVGRTKDIWGTVTIKGTTVERASIGVDMQTVQSDQVERNAQFDGLIMDVTQYPSAYLTLTSPIPLAPVPALGVVAHYRASGKLDMHGATKTVNFPVLVERTRNGLDVLADVPILFSRWNIENPSITGFVTTANHGTLEVLLYLTKGAGNPVSSAGPPLAPAGGTQITVPSTTIPPLKINSAG
ncbi:MAG: YceI family protein [Acidimicrobiales bacterium]